MTQASEILELIENVDPEDSEALDEIDGYVTSYIFEQELKLKPPPPKQDSHRLSMAHIDYARWCAGDVPYGYREYTRSRDALKSIRPDWGYEMYYQHMSNSVGFWCNLETYKQSFTSPVLPTEELAELHAIIQAIEYERQNML